MVRTLLRKELHQHWWALGLIALLAAIGYGLIALSVVTRGEAGSVFEVLRGFLIALVPFSALVLGHRLVVKEYQSRTQLFLEGLPVSRLRMIAVKYLLGLLFLGSVVLGAVAITSVLAGPREDPQLILSIAARCAAFTWFVYNFFFAMGFLGRYRAALFLGALIAFFAISEVTDLEPARFGPVQLVDEKFAYEEDLPPAALRTTVGLAAAFLGLAFVLGVLREGSVAALLAERMSHRERVVIAALLVGSLFAVSLLHEKRQKEPFDLHDAVSNQAGLVEVKVSPHGDEAASVALAGAAARELDALREYLALDDMPRVFITHRNDFDADAYERATLKEEDGLLVRANYTADGWEQTHFIEWLIRETLISQSEGRAKLESKMWVLDGFPLWWTRRSQKGDPIEADAKLAVRALAASNFSQADLKAWYLFRERVGEDVAAAVAWSGLTALHHRQGPDRFRQVARSILGANLPKDLRAYLHERRAALPRLLESEAGLTPSELWRGWQEDLNRARAGLGPALARVPTLQGEIEFVPLSADTRKAVYRLKVDPPPAPGTSYSLYYDELPVLDAEVDPRKLRRIQTLYSAGTEGELPETFPRGGRLYWTFSMNVPELGCDIVSGWRREEVQ